MRAFVVVPVCLFLSLAANATEMHKKATKSDKGPTDLTKTIAPTSHDWSGFYAGITLGGASNGSHFNTSVVDNSAYYAPLNLSIVNELGQSSANATHFSGGVEGGYTQQLGSFVFGVEGDVDFAPGKIASDATGALYIGQFATAPATITQQLSLNWMITARARGGVLLSPNWLVYGTGGVAFTQVEGKFAYEDYYPAYESASFQKTELGYVAGIGTEYAFDTHWSMKAEFLSFNFPSLSTTSNNLIRYASEYFTANVFTHSADLTSQVVRIGLNYTF